MIATLAVSGCRTAAVAPVPDELQVRANGYLAALAERHDELRSLRARARTEVDGASGEAFTRQLLLLEKPARLRIEVLGLLGQRSMVLATDGDGYDVFRAPSPEIEHGTVHPGVLWEVLGVPLAPAAAVSVLLAAPESPGSGAVHLVAWDGASGEAVISYADRTFRFDSAGHLRGYRWHPDGHDWVVARYDEWQEPEGGSAFPLSIALDFPANGGRVRVRFQEVEQNPELSPALFRLRPREPLSSGAEGEGG